VSHVQRVRERSIIELESSLVLQLFEMFTTLPTNVEVVL
jgi:hypothetical protein